MPIDESGLAEEPIHHPGFGNLDFRGDDQICSEQVELSRRRKRVIRGPSVNLVARKNAVKQTHRRSSPNSTAPSRAYAQYGEPPVVSSRLRFAAGFGHAVHCRLSFRVRCEGCGFG